MRENSYGVLCVVGTTSMHDMIPPCVLETINLSNCGIIELLKRLFSTPIHLQID